MKSKIFYIFRYIQPFFIDIFKLRIYNIYSNFNEVIYMKKILEFVKKYKIQIIVIAIIILLIPIIKITINKLDKN